MASDTNAYFGFELLNKQVVNDLVKKEDVIILFVHWFCVKNGFKCIGIGDSKTFDPSIDQGSELLPSEWNQRPNYSLRYVKDGLLYIMVAIRSDEDLLINFLRVNDSCTSNVQFPIELTVGTLRATDNRPLDSLIPNHRVILDKIRNELVNPVYNGTGRETSTQTPARIETRDEDPLRVRAPPPRIPRHIGRPEVDPRNIGRSDLDPFSQGGGGMIFDPFSGRHGIPHPLGGLGVPGTLPPGGAPPGARFDPFGPPDTAEGPRGRRRDPDADHFPPPFGSDDMFM